MLCLQPIGWLYPTEIQPLEIRAAAASLNTASNMVRPVCHSEYCHTVFTVVIKQPAS